MTSSLAQKEWHESQFHHKQKTNIFVERGKRKIRDGGNLLFAPTMRWCERCEIELAVDPRLKKCELCGNPFYET